MLNRGGDIPLLQTSEGTLAQVSAPPKTGVENAVDKPAALSLKPTAYAQKNAPGRGTKKLGQRSKAKVQGCGSRLCRCCLQSI